MTERKSPEYMFTEIAREYHDACMKLFRQNISRFVLVFIRYVFFGVLIWFLCYLRNTSLSLPKFIMFYNILFILLALFGYLFGIAGKKKGTITEYEYDLDTQKGFVSRLFTGIVGVISIPARGTIEAFLNLGNVVYTVTRNQYIFGMRFIHSLKKEVTLDFLQLAYHQIITTGELHKVLHFLKFLGLIQILQSGEKISIRPTKKLQQYQQRFNKPSDEFPSLNEMDRLHGILSYLRDRSIETPV